MVSCFAFAAAAAVFTLGPRVLGQAAQNDPAAQIQLATEHFDAARYREAMDAYDAAIRGDDADLVAPRAQGEDQGRRCGSRSSSCARVEAETLVNDAPSRRRSPDAARRRACGPTASSTSPTPRIARRLRWRPSPPAPISVWPGRWRREASWTRR